MSRSVDPSRRPGMPCAIVCCMAAGLLATIMVMVPALEAQRATNPAPQRDTSRVPRDTSRRDAARRDTTRRDSTRVRTLPPVRVVATPTHRADAASAVTILPRVIRTAPATNAWELVRQTAGVEVHEQGQGPGFASDAVMRGFTSDHSTDVAITIDGVPINQPVNGHAEGYADWNEIMPEAVSQIRVLKGPVSPWVGNFAMGGEVEVHSAPVALGTRFSARGGSFGDGRLALVTGNAGTQGGFVLAGDAQRSDGWRPNSRSSLEHLLFNRTWLSADSGTTELGVRGYAAQWDSPGFLTASAFQSGDFQRAADRTDGGSLANGTLRGAITRTVHGGMLRSLLYGRIGQWHLFLNIPPEGGIGEGALSQTEELDRRIDGGGNTRYEHELGPVHVMAGVGYRAVRASYQRYFTTQRVRDSAFMYDDGTPAHLTATYLALSPALEAHWDPIARLTIGVGARLDWMRYAVTPHDEATTRSDAHVVLSPKVSALYQLTPALSAYAAFNGGFRAADGAIKDPALAPSRAWASEIGLRASALRFEGSVALFDVEVTNEQTFNPATLASTANGRSRRRGVELDGRVGVTPSVALFTHATFNDAHYLRLVSDDGDTLSGVPVFGVARATIEGGVDVQLHGVLGSLWAAYTGAFTPIDEADVRTSPFTLLNARGSIPLTSDWSLALGIRNILDRRYPEVWASGYVSPGEPRMVLVAVEWSAGGQSE